MKFRHLVRNIYAFELDEAKMNPLVEGISRTEGEFAKEVEQFIYYLHQLATRIHEES